MEEKIKAVIGEQAFFIIRLQVQLDAVKAENEQLKKALAEFAQGQMFTEAQQQKTNGEARPS
jgi:transposase-like protein